MIALQIFAATLMAGIGSVWLAAFLGYGLFGRWLQGCRACSSGLFNSHMLSLAAGALLSTAFMHLLPEAFESDVSTPTLFTALLFGLLFFFLLDKAELWHHGHEHHHAHGTETPPDALHEHKPTAAHSHKGSWSVLLGDSVHAFGDGLLIASAFMVAPQLGWLSALAVLAHEVPHHMGDLIVLRSHSGNLLRVALLKVSLAGAVTLLGGLLTFYLLQNLKGDLSLILPYLLVLASSSFIYVALADLIPQLQKRLNLRQTLTQIIWLLLGISLVSAASALAHAR